MKSFKLSDGKRDGTRLSYRMLVGVAIFITGLYLMLLGYFFFLTTNFINALVIGVASLAFVKFVAPRLLLPVLGKNKHNEIIDWGTKGLSRINLIFVILAILSRELFLFETFLPNLEYSSAEDIIFGKVFPLVLLSSFVYVIYLAIVSGFKRKEFTKFTKWDKSMTPEQVIAKMDKLKAK